MPYLHCYTRNICQIWRVETSIYQEDDAWLGKRRKILEHVIDRE